MQRTRGPKGGDSIHRSSRGRREVIEVAEGAGYCGGCGKGGQGGGLRAGSHAGAGSGGHKHSSPSGCSSALLSAARRTKYSTCLGPRATCT